MRKLLLTLVLCSTLPAADFDQQRYLEHIKFLASEKMKGRGTGTPELDLAADYIAREFKAIGLSPVEGSYFQKFPVTTQARLGNRNKLRFYLGGEKLEMKPGSDFLPLNLSAEGEVEGELAFVGYGISAPEYNYDDFAGIDVRGKIVVMLRREPQETDDKSPFNGRVYTRHAQFDSKAVNAKLHGAKAAIVVSDLLSTGYGDVEKFARNAGPANAGIPVMMLRGEIAEKLFAAAGKPIRTLHNDIDKDLQPRSFLFPATTTAYLRADVSREVRQVRNVVGYLPGKSDEYLVIGAHYDHLGLGEQFSMAPSMSGKPHVGADDNASGTAGVIELARYFATLKDRDRGVLFMAFAGEELGLLGSSYFVNNPALPLENAVAMINMDMIGRIQNNKVYVGGSGTGSTLKSIVEKTQAPGGLQFDFSETAGYGSSDHTSFTAKQVPVLFFFSGLHGDYHKPSDTWDKINPGSAVNLLAYIGGIGQKLLEAERPQYVRVLPPANPHATGSSGTAPSGSGYGPYFGSIPDFAEPPKGVRFADVRDGSPASKGGLKAGDIMIEFDGKPVSNLMDFTVLLRQKKVGDKVVVKALRGTDTVTANVTLEARK